MYRTNRAQAYKLPTCSGDPHIGHLDYLFKFHEDVHVRGFSYMNEILGTDTQRGRWTRLQIAVWRGEEDILLQELIDDEDFDIVDEEGWSLPHIAVSSGRTRILEILLSLNKKMINYQNNAGLTPLMMAIPKRDTKCAKLLSEHGADLDLLDINGMTALTKAINLNRVDMVQLLIEAGANVNRYTVSLPISKYIYTRNPLDLAVRWRCVEIVSLLLKAGAEIEGMFEDTREPIPELAEKDREINRLLVEYGVKRSLWQQWEAEEGSITWLPHEVLTDVCSLLSH